MDVACHGFGACRNAFVGVYALNRDNHHSHSERQCHCKNIKLLINAKVTYIAMKAIPGVTPVTTAVTA